MITTCDNFTHEVDAIATSPSSISVLSQKPITTLSGAIHHKSSWDFLHYHSTNLNRRKMKNIRKHLRKDNLVAASDGSAHEGNKGSFAFCFAKKNNGKILFQSHSPTLCDPESIHSDRCEICGLLGIVTTIENVIASSNNPSSYHNKTITVWTDSETAISAATTTIHHTTKTAFQNNIDVILELQHQVRKNPIKFDFKWVKSHQDEE